MLNLLIKSPFWHGGFVRSLIDGAVPMWLFAIMVLSSVLVPYLLGSINTAIIVSGKMYNDDIRRYGSGNAGFTNMMRTYGGKAAVITFVGDMLKTAVAIMFGWLFLGHLTANIAALACFVGHIYPVFYGFKGGKGVVCLATTILVFDIRIFAVLAVIFVLVVYMTKYISFGAVLCAMLYPLIVNRWVMHASSMGFVSVAMAALIVFKHRSNIKRIFNGTESKFEFKKSKSKSEKKTDGKNAE